MNAKLNLYVMLLVVIANMTLGVMTYLSNRKRKPNFFFFLVCISIGFWLGARVYAYYIDQFATDKSMLKFWIVQAYAGPLFIPFSIDLLRSSIIRPEAGLLDIFKRAKLWLLCIIAIGLTFQTPYFITGLTQEPGVAYSIPSFGPAFPVYIIYFVVTLGLNIFRLSVDSRRLSGVRRSELQIILFAFIAATLFALGTDVIPHIFDVPIFVTALPPLAIILFDFIIAYGIATKRVLDVTSVLRLTASYGLLTAYLIGLYFVSFWGLGHVFQFTGVDSRFLVHLLSALILAFSMAPAHGMLQHIANLFFIRSHTVDVEATLQRTGQQLRYVKTVDELLQHFLNTVADAFGTDQVHLLLQSADGFSEYRPASDQGNPALLHIPPASILPQHLSTNNLPISGDVLKRSQPTRETAELQAQLNEMGAKVAVGIYSKAEVSGILLLGDRLSGTVYGSNEMSLLQLIAGQFAAALENAQLFTQVQDAKIYNDILLENMVSGVIALDQEEKITIYNREAQRVLQVPVNQLLHQGYQKLPPAIFNAYRQTAHAKMQLLNKEVSFSNGSQEFVLRMGTAVIQGPNNEFMGCLIVFHDVTELKRMEQQIRRTDRLASIGTLSAGMAHEIKNPLVSIKTFTQLLPERYHDEDFRNTFSELIGSEVDRIDSIVNQVLEFARPPKPELTEVNLHQVVGNSVRLLNQQFTSKRIEIRLACDAEMDNIEGDPGQLGQVIVNLLLNAMDAMPEGGELHLTTRLHKAEHWSESPAAKSIQLTIRDTGSGISKQDLAHIFDPFFTTKNSGTGLGLSIVHGILEEHHATIDVKSEVGGGTEFSLSFPVLMEGVTA